MIGGMRSALVAQVAAGLVSVALSGAPRVAAAHAPAAAHRCLCPARAGAHACECSRCRNAGLAAAAPDERLAPCHRGPARRASSPERRDPARTSPCFEGTCGGSGEAAPLPPALDPFLAPASRAVARAPRAEAIAAPLLAGAARPLEPDVPPPRAA